MLLSKVPLYSRELRLPVVAVPVSRQRRVGRSVTPKNRPPVVSSVSPRVYEIRAPHRCPRCYHSNIILYVRVNTALTCIVCYYKYITIDLRLRKTIRTIDLLHNIRYIGNSAQCTRNFFCWGSDFSSSTSTASGARFRDRFDFFPPAVFRGAFRVFVIAAAAHTRASNVRPATCGKPLNEKPIHCTRDTRNMIVFGGRINV
jgi:hypothetical protein